MTISKSKSRSKSRSKSVKYKKHKTIASGIYTTVHCRRRNKKLFKPLKHQQELISSFVNSKEKGMIVFHRLGSGKTCSAIYIADKMITEKTVEKVFILSPGSLRNNFIEEYCLKCGIHKKTLREQYVFITYNYNVAKNLHKVDFNNSLVIIDEVHNLIQSVVNQSKNSVALYDKIKASNARVLALSGTPVNDIYHLSPLINLVKHQVITPYEVTPNNVFRYAQGIVSYYPGYKDGYPRVNEKEPIQVAMSSFQSQLYQKTYKQESIRRRRKPSEKLRKTNPAQYEIEMTNYIMSRLWLRSRKISNFFYTDDIRDTPDLLVQNNGWISNNTLNNAKLKYLSPKFVALITNILNNFEGKHMVYSFFKTKSGVILLNTLLNKCGIKSVIFSGDETPAKKNKIIEAYNNRKNDNGSSIKVILVTEAGAEGINLLSTNNMHILESSPNETKITQAIGRVVRYNSHQSLPVERRFVNIWRYWSIPSIGTSIDMKLFVEGKEKQNVIADVLDIFKKVSVTSY